VINRSGMGNVPKWVRTREVVNWGAQIDWIEDAGLLEGKTSGTLTSGSCPVRVPHGRTRPAALVTDLEAVHLSGFKAVGRIAA